MTLLRPCQRFVQISYPPLWTSQILLVLFSLFILKSVHIEFRWQPKLNTTLQIICMVLLYVYIRNIV